MPDVDVEDGEIVGEVNENCNNEDWMQVPHAGSQVPTTTAQPGWDEPEPDVHVVKRKPKKEKKNKKKLAAIGGPSAANGHGAAAAAGQQPHFVNVYGHNVSTNAGSQLKHNCSRFWQNSHHMHAGVRVLCARPADSCAACTLLQLCFDRGTMYGMAQLNASGKAPAGACASVGSSSMDVA